MVMLDIIGQNPYRVIIPDDIKDIVRTPASNIKLSDHIHELISVGALDVRGLPVYISALEVENLQKADNPKNTGDRETCTLNAKIYHDCLNRPKEQAELCLREASVFFDKETHAQAMTVMTGLLVQTRDWKAEALVAHNAAQNWRNIANKINPLPPHK